MIVLNLATFPTIYVHMRAGSGEQPTESICQGAVANTNKNCQIVHTLTVVQLPYQGGQLPHQGRSRRLV